MSSSSADTTGHAKKLEISRPHLFSRSPQQASLWCDRLVRILLRDAIANRALSDGTLSREAERDKTKRESFTYAIFRRALFQHLVAMENRGHVPASSYTEYEDQLDDFEARGTIRFRRFSAEPLDHNDMPLAPLALKPKREMTGEELKSLLIRFTTLGTRVVDSNPVFHNAGHPSGWLRRTYNSIEAISYRDLAGRTTEDLEENLCQIEYVLSLEAHADHLIQAFGLQAPDGKSCTMCRDLTDAVKEHGDVKDVLLKYASRLFPSKSVQSQGYGFPKPMDYLIVAFGQSTLTLDEIEHKIRAVLREIDQDLEMSAKVLIRGNQHLRESRRKVFDFYGALSVEAQILN